MKVPRYEEISEWINDWLNAQSPESIEEAFRLYGFVSPENFKKEKLHKLLKDCYSDNFCEDQWQTNHGSSFENRSEMDSWIARH